MITPTPSPARSWRLTAGVALLTCGLMSVAGAAALTFWIILDPTWNHLPYAMWGLPRAVAGLSVGVLCVALGIVLRGRPAARLAGRQ